MAERKNITCYMRDFKRLEQNGRIGRDKDDDIFIVWTPLSGYRQTLTSMTSRDARLLARRINEFLDAGG